MSENGFTGRRRVRTTRRSVKITDRSMRALITLGGLATIVSVLLIMVFLVWVALPLFSGGRIADETSFPVKTGPSSRRILRIGVDEYRTTCWEVRDDGVLTVRRLDTGKILSSRPLFPDRTPSAIAFSDVDDQVMFGFADGSLTLGKIGFETTFLPDSDSLPAEVRALSGADCATYDGAVVERTPEGQLRQQKIRLEAEAPTKLESGARIVRLAFSGGKDSATFAALTDDGRVYVEEAVRRENWMTGEVTRKLTGGSFPVAGPPGSGLPTHLLLAGLGTDLYMLWDDGHLVRMNVRDPQKPVRAETLPSVLANSGEQVGPVAFLAGETSLLIGDTSGSTRVWFPTKPPDADSLDGQVLVDAHDIRGPAAVTALAPSPRGREVAIGYADGSIRYYNVTTQKLAADTVTRVGEPVRALVVAPKADGILALTDDSIWHMDLDAPHPDVTLQALFAPVWYEGYSEPKQSWQTTGTGGYEPKYGLFPLVYGTLKATFYSMLFGLPLALLAAVYASEFLHPKVKAKVKPAIEIMASLPSVVLGFLGGLVIAPFVAGRLAAVISAFFTIPFVLLLGAHLWQLLPTRRAIRLARLRFPLIVLAVPVGIALGALLGPLTRDLLFGGDIRAWLDSDAGSGSGGWVLILLPLSGLAVALLTSRLVGPRLRRLSADWDRPACALLDLGKFLSATLLTLLLAGLVAVLLGHGLGLDPRGALVGTYVTRNALIVGFVMGFAIIPIIFTIAEDALSAVPEHLRSASLGAGATPWQTAVRIIIPTAMSGLFSAMMIGLGRAVGETMIVLMAAGNTPIMKWNPFNGFETLSAALATELPEAVRNSTHYRVLFFAALVLFAMTFVLNTVAEAVRLRFRKRAFEL